MPLASLRCIFFDLDGTLCDYGIDPREALEGVSRGHGIDAALDPFEYYEFYKVVAAERPGESFEQISDEAYRRLLSRAGYDDLELAREIAAEYRRVRLESLSIFPGTNRVLQDLSRRYELGVISNGPSQIQRAKLSKFHLGDFFKTIVISGEAGVEKPDEAIFRLALEGLDARPTESAHVGDSLKYDVTGALRAGFTSFWVNRGVLQYEVTEVAPHYELNDLRELPPILDGRLTPP